MPEPSLAPPPGGDLARPAAAVVGELDFTRERDRGLVRTSIKSGWGITNETKHLYLRALNAALGWAITKQDPGQVQRIVQTMTHMVGQDQADAHLEFRSGNPEHHVHRHEHVVATMDGFALRIAQICLDLLPDDKIALFHQRVADEMKRLKPE